MFEGYKRWEKAWRYHSKTWSTVQMKPLKVSLKNTKKNLCWPVAVLSVGVNSLKVSASCRWHLRHLAVHFSTTHSLYNHRVILDSWVVWYLPHQPTCFTLMNDWEVGGKEGIKERREYSPLFQLRGGTHEIFWGVKATKLWQQNFQLKSVCSFDFFYPKVYREAVQRASKRHFSL